jgi:hypothetical protein
MRQCAADSSKAIAPFRSPPSRPGIGRFWWTRELFPWRRALFEAATRKRVVVGGLDDQVSITSHYAKEALPRLIAAASSQSSAALCRQTVSRNLGWTYHDKNPFDEREQLRLQERAKNAAGAGAANPSVDAGDRVMLESSWALMDSGKLRAIGRIPSRLLGKFVSETWSDYFDALARGRPVALAHSHPAKADRRYLPFAVSKCALPHRLRSSCLNLPTGLATLYLVCVVAGPHRPRRRDPPIPTEPV